MLRGPAMSFTAEEPQTRAFINEINRSGNQLVVYDYMTGTDKILEVDDNWYIDHLRIQCTVDGQQVWDYVDYNDYFWLYGSHHNCFGWLFVGPSGYNTITFFGEHPEFDKTTQTLPLAPYTFTMESPLYDFMYSDVTKRSYTQANPDSSPVGLHLNHMFSAYRFRIRNVRQVAIAVKSATLKVVTKKQANISFADAIANPEASKADVSFNDCQSGTLTQSRGAGSVLENNSSYINLFDLNDTEAYRMMWPQDETEFQGAKLELTFQEEGKSEVETKVFKLNDFAQKEWLAGNRYAYDLVFTDQEIRLVCNVEPWDKKNITLDFTDVVVVSDKIQWHNDTAMDVDEHDGVVVLFNDKAKPAECYFKIDAPTGATWVASLITVEGKGSDAFEFVNPANTVEVLPAPSGPVGQIGRVMIRVKDATSQTNTNKAKLRIIVRTANNEQTIVVENLCAGHDYNEYTIVQNMM